MRSTKRRRSPGTDRGGEGGTSGNWGGGATEGTEKSGAPKGKDSPRLVDPRDLSPHQRLQPNFKNILLKPRKKRRGLRRAA